MSKEKENIDKDVDISADAQADNTVDNEDVLGLRNKMAEADGNEAAAMISELEENVKQSKADVPKRSIGSKIFIIIIAALVVLGVVRAVQLQNKTVDDEEKTLTNVKVQTVSLGSVELTTPLAGRIQAKDTINVVPLASGKVQSVNVEVGDVVSAGQNLFTIDSTQAELQYQQAVLNVKNLEDAIDTIERNLTRTRSLYEAGAAAKTDVEQLETSYDSTQIQLNQAKISVDQAAESLSYYNVTAPSGGYVTAVNVVAGGLAGQSAAAVVISDTSVLELNAGLSEYLISSVHVGDTVNVSIE
jgi:multidrug efflux pump subunit AcrA (membrane-fusion protein)